MPNLKEKLEQHIELVLKIVVVFSFLAFLVGLVATIYSKYSEPKVTDLDCQHICFMGSAMTDMYSIANRNTCKCCNIYNIRGLGNLTTCEHWRMITPLNWTRSL